MPPCASPTASPTTQLSSSPTPRKVSKKVVSTVKAAAEPQMPPLDAPRCAADVLGWHVILKDMTDPAILNGESGVVTNYDREDLTDFFRVRLDFPRDSIEPFVRCFFSNLTFVQRGSRSAQKDNPAQLVCGATELEKSVANLLAIKRIRRP